MAIQTTFGRALAGASAGTPGNSSFGHRASYQNDEGTAIAAGIAVAYKSAGKVEMFDAASDVVAGIVVNDMVQDADGLTGDQYAPDDAMVSVQEEGAVYVHCEQTVTPADPVYVRHTVNTTELLGAFRKDADSGKARLLKGARFVQGGGATTPPIVWFSKAADTAAMLQDSEDAALVGVNVANLTGTLTGTANGSMVDVAAAAGACAGTTTPNAGNVDAAIATAVAPIVSGVNEQLKELQTTLNALLTSVRNSGQIA